MYKYFYISKHYKFESSIVITRNNFKWLTLCDSNKKKMKY